MSIEKLQIVGDERDATVRLGAEIVPHFEHSFDTTVARCMVEGLVGGEGLAVDASLIRADASRQSGGLGSDGLPADADTHAVREYLAVLDDAAFGAATPVVPRYLAPVDSASRWTARIGGRPSTPTRPTT